MYELTDGILLHHAALAAEELGLYELLEGGTRSLAELSEGLGLARRPVDLLVGAAGTFGLVEREGDAVFLSAAGRAFLPTSSPTCLGPLLGLGRELVRSHYSYDTLLAALRADRGPHGPADSWIEDLLRQPGRLEGFIRAMHAHAVPAAAAWAERLPLDGASCLLDLGGGSGAHALAAAAANPGLRAIVFELPQVAALARTQIAGSGLAQRVRVMEGDLWRDAFPAADLHFYSDIFHDWPIPRVRELAAKSFAALSSGGRILVHEMLLDEDRNGPPAVVASGLAMLLCADGQQFSAGELGGLLAEVGFEGIEVMPTFGLWSLVLGVKR